jgi:anti-anti-sigma regulatory factor
MLRVIDHGRLALVSVDLASLDASSARGVRAAIKPELKPGRVLVLDLAKVEFIDSSSASAANWSRRAASSSCAACSPRCAR